MHGCPPAEIEAILKYLIQEKKLHTFVKLNPTLLGYKYVRETFDKMGYHYIELKEESFTHDLHFEDAVAMLQRLKDSAVNNKKDFGVKLSNTLPVKIIKGELPGEEMYLSGRALYPLTINLALKLAQAFEGDLKISYSGGADFFNIQRIFAAGIRPITLATTLLKPGGYFRFKQIAQLLEPQLDNQESSELVQLKLNIESSVGDSTPTEAENVDPLPLIEVGVLRLDKLDLEKLKSLAEGAFDDAHHLKDKRSVSSRKIAQKLPLTDCFIAPCTQGCPIEQDAPEYIRLVGEKRYEEAYEVIVSKNPLPFITGTLCNHHCMTKCTRLDYEESVQIRGQKLIAAQQGYAGFMQKLVLEKTKSEQPLSFTKVAVIGAGPSGLSAAYFLAKAGLDVTVFDKREGAGGTVEYVIPDFRLSREAISKDIELIKKMGVKFKFGVNPKLSVDSYLAKGFRYVYLAIGAGKTKKLKLIGDSERVMGAIPFLEAFNTNKDSLTLGENVAVVGGGNSAMDAARAVLRVKGVQKVYIIYRRTKEYMPAAREELNLAVEEGVIFKELLTPTSLTEGVLKCQAMELGQPDATGRRSSLVKVGAFEELLVDTVLSAIGELVDSELLMNNGLVIDGKDTEKNEDSDKDKLKIIVNPKTLETSVNNVFIGGDALYGPSTVVEAIANGTKVAKAILAKEQLGDENQVLSQIPFNQEKQLLEIAEKKGILKEVCDAEEESSRCLECHSVCNICTEVCPNRANLVITVKEAGLADLNQVIHLDGLCNECGNCATFCLYEGAPYKDKLTLFWSETDLEGSTNRGFLLEGNGTEAVFKLRLDGEIISVKFDEFGDTTVGIEKSIAAIIWTVFKQYRYLF